MEFMLLPLISYLAAAAYLMAWIIRQCWSTAAENTRLVVSTQSGWKGSLSEIVEQIHPSDWNSTEHCLCIHWRICCSLVCVLDFSRVAAFGLGYFGNL